MRGRNVFKSASPPGPLLPDSSVSVKNDLNTAVVATPGLAPDRVAINDETVARRVIGEGVGLIRMRRVITRGAPEEAFDIRLRHADVDFEEVLPADPAGGGGA